MTNNVFCKESRIIGYNDTSLLNNKGDLCGHAVVFSENNGKGEYSWKIRKGGGKMRPTCSA